MTSVQSSYHFNSSVDNIPSYALSYSLPIGDIVRKVSMVPMDNANLGAAIRIGGPGSSLAIAGSADPAGALRMTSDPERISACSTYARNYITSFEASPSGATVKTVLPVRHPVIALAAVAPHTFLAAMGNGKTSMYQYLADSADHSIDSPPYVCPGTSHWHSALTSGLAASPLDPSKLITASIDSEIAVVDISMGMTREKNTLQACHLNMRYANSVTWCNTNPMAAMVASNCVGNADLTKNTSLAEMHDLRGKWNPVRPAFVYNCNRSLVTTICSLENHLMLLGFNDGEIRLVDQRNPKEAVAATVDPYVEFISGIQYNPRSQAFIVSGLQDFTVWKVDDIERLMQRQQQNNSSLYGGAFPSMHDSMNGQPDLVMPGTLTTTSFSSSVWSHSHPSRNRKDREGSVGFFAQFWDDDSILVTDTTAKAHLYKQGFNMAQKMQQHTEIPRKNMYH